MSIVERIGRALVLAPHPDDEVLGCGGTIARLAALGREVHVAICTTGTPPRYHADGVAALRAEAAAAHARLGVTGARWLDFPAAGLDTVAAADLNDSVADLVAGIEPDTLFLPFVGDIHGDHQRVFSAGLVAARPRQGAYPGRILAYETLSETNWNAPYLSPGFHPGVFIDIAGHLEAKLDAFSCYRSQLRRFPHERSPEAVGALARLRGATVCREAAEAFVLVRDVG